MRYWLQTTKKNNNLWFHFPSIYFRIRGLQSSFLLILFRYSYSPSSCSQKLLQNEAKNLKTVKIEKQNKTKQKGKTHTIFWNLMTIEPSTVEMNQLWASRSDTHELLAPNYKEQQQLMISLKFSISLGFRWAKSQSMLPSIYFRIRGLQSSFLLILFRYSYSPSSCSQKLLQNEAKNLKTVKIEKQNKTKQKGKTHTIFWNLMTIEPSTVEMNQIEGAKIIFKRAFQATSVPTLTVLNNSLYLLSQEIFRKSCRLKIPFPPLMHWEIALKSRVIRVSRDKLNSAMAQSLNIDPRQGFLFLLWLQRRIILSAWRYFGIRHAYRKGPSRNFKYSTFSTTRLAIRNSGLLGSSLE